MTYVTLADVPDRLAIRLSVPTLALLGGLIAAAVIANTVVQVRLNTWNGDFYGAIEARNLPAFLDQLVVFLVLAAVLLVLVVAQTWLVEIAKIRMRQRLTGELLDGWLAPRRPFELGLAGEAGANPDQRLQEDIRHLAELSVGLGTGLLQSSLLLLTFFGVLWTLSTPMPVTLFGETVVVHGLMLWGTLAFSALGSLLTFRVGAPLVRIHRQRYAEEAAFRATVARAAEAAQEIAFQRGEAAERRTIGGAFGRAVAVGTELAGAVASVTWVTSGYGWLALVAPAVLAAPAYFSGALSFGGLMMAVQAFYQVNQSLRWFVDNYPTIADWRATRARVAEFREAVDRVDALGEGEGRIALLPSKGGDLVFDRLCIKLPEGCARFAEERIVIRPGERVLVVGEAGAGKSMLFRAMAGLWPWGSGTILVPPPDDVMFLTPRPYIPAGTLREVLTYPASAEGTSDAALAAVLARVSLGAYAGDLDVVRRWERELTVDEQQRLAFARCLVRRPRWVFLDEAASACADDHRAVVLSVLTNELRGTAVVALARDPDTDGLFDRRLVLSRTAAPRLRLSLPRERRGGRARGGGEPGAPGAVPPVDVVPAAPGPARIAGVRPPPSGAAAP